MQYKSYLSGVNGNVDVLIVVDDVVYVCVVVDVCDESDCDCVCGDVDVDIDVVVAVFVIV